MITKRTYGLKSTKSLWDRLILDLNRASQAIGYSIEHIRQMAKALKALFDLVLHLKTEESKADGCHHAPEGGKDQGDAAITGMSLAGPGQGQTNQQQGVDMPFGTGQLFQGNQSLDKVMGVRPVRGIA